MGESGSQAVPGSSPSWHPPSLTLDCSSASALSSGSGVWSCALLPLTHPCPHSVPQGSVRSERDYESLVMMRMRQAAERQQLIAQMQQEDKAAQPT